MKSVFGIFIIAVVLFVGGALCLSESRVMRRVAAQEQRLATLQYAADEAAGSATALVDRVPLPFVQNTSVETQRAAADYWQARYEALTPLIDASGQRPSSDPGLLLIAANATFRASPVVADNQRGSVERLDSVMQAYGDVLRADPTNLDAAYNYEYVARLRDAVAKGRLPVRAAKDHAKDQKAGLSDDLPIGPTVHGRPGGPPPEVPMADFKTFTPLQNDERGDLMERDRQRVSRGKG
jgi:hypothetical protein